MWYAVEKFDNGLSVTYISPVNCDFFGDLSVVCCPDFYLDFDKYSRYVYKNGGSGLVPVLASKTVPVSDTLKSFTGDVYCFERLFDFLLTK